MLRHKLRVIPECVLEHQQQIALRSLQVGGTERARAAGAVDLGDEESRYQRRSYLNNQQVLLIQALLGV